MAATIAHSEADWVHALPLVLLGIKLLSKITSMLLHWRRESVRGFRSPDNNQEKSSQQKGLNSYYNLKAFQTNRVDGVILQEGLDILLNNLISLFRTSYTFGCIPKKLEVSTGGVYKEKRLAYKSMEVALERFEVTSDAVKW
ncbi:hypothetical protein J6590_008973 [Homalodisca vitripennis]|nr:hypothetical protein J6590_008973 [Homalodisca vitripennis]